MTWLNPRGLPCPRPPRPGVCQRPSGACGSKTPGRLQFTDVHPLLWLGCVFEIAGLRASWLHDCSVSCPTWRPTAPGSTAGLAGGRREAAEAFVAGLLAAH